MTQVAVSNSTFQRDGRGRLRGAVRVAAYAACLGLLGVALSASLGRAEARERLGRAGLELLEALGPRFVGEPQAVLINGQPMFLASKLVADDVAGVLDGFEQYCTRDAPKSAGPLGADPYTWLRSRLENTDGSEGHIACLVPREPVHGLPRLLERASAFAHSGDLAELGEVRYAVARRNSESNSTHVLTMWTEGAFNVRAMFTEEGDAPGDDPADLPRPRAARRVLSARLANHPYSLRFYDSEASHASVLDGYAEDMAARDWSALTLPARGHGHDMNQNVHVFVRDGRAVIVTVSDTPAGKTGVSLLEMESTGFVRGSSPAMAR
jgi:hypothetical protein